MATFISALSAAWASKMVTPQPSVCVIAMCHQWQKLQIVSLPRGEMSDFSPGHRKGERLKHLSACIPMAPLAISMAGGSSIKMVWSCKPSARATFWGGRVRNRFLKAGGGERGMIIITWLQRRMEGGGGRFAEDYYYFLKRRGGWDCYYYFLQEGGRRVGLLLLLHGC